MTKGLPILLDDEDAHRLIAIRALKKIGVPVREAASLSEARRLVQEVPPSFMIIDRNLNGESGLTMVCELRKGALTSGIPLIMLSTSEELSDIWAAYTSGVDLYIFKEAEQTAYSKTLTSAVNFISSLKNRQ